MKADWHASDQSHAIIFFQKIFELCNNSKFGQKSIVVANQAKERTKGFYICWCQYMFYCWDIFWRWFSTIFVKYKPKVFDFVPEKFTLLRRTRYSGILQKTENKRCKSSSWNAAATMILSIYAATPVNPVRMPFIVCWNMAGSSLTSKLRRLNQKKNPCGCW